MALLFSHVQVTTPDGNEAEFLVSGIPREFDDFEYYTAFEDFLDGIEEDTEISVHAEAYGNPDLGINASNEEYLERHPYASREYYSLCNFDMSEVEIVDQMELPGMSMGGM